MSEQLKTPILFLIFNRLDTTKIVFEEIKKQKPKKLFIAADGPRINKKGEDVICNEIKDYVLKNINWNCEIKTLFRKNNLGCGKAVSEAITWFFKNVEQGIILEDDCVPSQSFFGFCESLLEKYKNNREITMISGTNYLFNSEKYEYSYYFSKHCYVWGWATWKRAWNKFNIEDELVKKREIKKYFIDKKSKKYFINQIEYFKYNYMDTWDVQWMSHIIKNNLLTIVPIKNQISNIGVSGTHTNDDIPLSINMPTENIVDLKYNNDIKYNPKFDKISIKNIEEKIIKKSKIKNLIINIIGRKIIYKIKNFSLKK